MLTELMRVPSTSEALMLLMSRIATLSPLFGVLLEN